MPATRSSLARLFPAAVSAALLASSASAQFSLYGVRGTNLITINPDDPTQVTTVGATGIGAASVVSMLAYHPVEKMLYGIGTTVLGGGADYRFDLYRINPTTGAGTAVATLGLLTVAGPYGGLEYVAGTLNSLVVTRGPANSFNTTRLYTLNSTTGVSTQLFSSISGTTDNDTGAYDSNRNIFYTLDANTGARFERINLSTGAATHLPGAIPSTVVDAAFDAGRDAFFLNDSGANLYRATTDGVGTTTVITVGAVTGGHVHSLAYIPEPSSFWVAAFALCAAPRLRRRRGSAA